MVPVRGSNPAGILFLIDHISDPVDSRAAHVRASLVKVTDIGVAMQFQIAAKSARHAYHDDLTVNVPAFEQLLRTL
jgi:hypothetical protein